MTALRNAYELIKDEERWTQGEMARDANGDPTSPYSPTAVSWCASGAYEATRCTDEWHYLNDAAAALFPWVPKDPAVGAVVWVNDVEGHAAVLQVFEKAIVELEGSL